SIRNRKKKELPPSFFCFDSATTETNVGVPRWRLTWQNFACFEHYLLLAAPSPVALKNCGHLPIRAFPLQFRKKSKEKINLK
ncbi:hypothetical protein, partial [Actinoplanes solisilvae]|uniref:hypothetical protein n=1 Tax=Actinoplanes solisilvae TaxID=2486853 RepID=UPI00196B9583